MNDPLCPDNVTLGPTRQMLGLHDFVVSASHRPMPVNFLHLAGAAN
jgi:hypothetical protein